ncbi:MAG: hydantoinase [Acidimicrobiales bacterium]|nr:hydantoinase [Acidimicrobiales bacterium]
MRIGVDVGGTFTKAVAFDSELGKVVAQASVATTHEHPEGVARGVVQVVGQVAEQVGPANVELVTHSTTQSVNALLEGDVALVGMIGMGRRPDLRKARKRTTLPPIDLGSGHELMTVSVFLDVTDGLDEATVRSAIEGLQDRGARAIAAAGAFAPDDNADETLISKVATEMGLPVTTSAELSGLYGLELRAVTACLNASILPVATSTALVVEAGVAAAGITSPVMVMRGDGGATDLEAFRTAPARTLYSGPAASVAGALRSGRVEDGVIIEVGGTSSNIAAIRRGQPALSYVQAGGRATAIRAIDVRVIGVAGGSMLRVRRGKVYGVGPRSAHIAGCGYACFTPDADLTGATVELVAPKPGDRDDHVVITLADRRRLALTNTCAANALGLVEPADHAAGDATAALAAFDYVGRLLRLDGAEVARRMMSASTQAIGDLVAAVAKDHHLDRPVLVAVGGGAGGLGRAVAAGMGLEVVVPEHAAVISAVGDALSLIRAEREQTVDSANQSQIELLIAATEGEALAAGASIGSLDVRVTHIKDRNAVRVTVTGAVGLRSGAVPGRPVASPDDVASLAAERGHPTPIAAGQFWISARLEPDQRVVVFDRYGDVVIDVAGEVLPATAPDQEVTAAIRRRTRQMGPVTLVPDGWIVNGSRLIHLDEHDLATPSGPRGAAGAGAEAAQLIIGRE